MPGSVFKEALEEAVSKYPVLDGRFPAISGFKLQFDPSKPAYDRVSPDGVKPDAYESLNMNELYTVAVTSYLAKGGDGFSMFKKEGVKAITEDENSLWVIDLVKQFFNRTSKDFIPAAAREARRTQRFKLFNVDEEDPENISQDGKWLMVRPQIDGRLKPLSN